MLRQRLLFGATLRKSRWQAFSLPEHFVDLNQVADGFATVHVVRPTAVARGCESGWVSGSAYVKLLRAFHIQEPFWSTARVFNFFEEHAAAAVSSHGPGQQQCTVSVACCCHHRFVMQF